MNWLDEMKAILRGGWQYRAWRYYVWAFTPCDGTGGLWWRV